MSSDGFISERYWECRVSLPQFSYYSINRVNDFGSLSFMLICAHPTLSVIPHSHLAKEIAYIAKRTLAIVPAVVLPTSGPV